MTPGPSRAPEALLFDLGGVLVDIDFGLALNAWAPYSALSLAELREAFSHDLPYQRHERGEIGGAEYFRHLAKTLRLTATPEQIERGWNAIFVAEIARTRALVESLRGTVPCYVFTNTNPSHMAAWSRLFPGVVDAFDRVFTSHELGLRKPERAAFDRICQLTHTSAQSMVFFDDLRENVEGARAAGLQGVLVRSPEDVASSLKGFWPELST
jgi:glucose-1-phosphatase